MGCSRRSARPCLSLWRWPAPEAEASSLGADVGESLGAGRESNFDARRADLVGIGGLQLGGRNVEDNAWNEVGWIAGSARDRMDGGSADRDHLRIRDHQGCGCEA